MSISPHPHDQAVRLAPKDLTLLTSIDQAVSEAVAAFDARPALNFGASLRRSGQAVAIGLAKLAWELRVRWAKSRVDGGFGQDVDDFADAVGAAWGYAPQTIHKYANAWESVLSKHPELYGKPMESLLLLTAAAREGQLEPADWKAVEKAPDKATIRDIVRQKRGQHTSSGTALIKIMERDGTLRVRRGGGAYKPYGMLVLNSDDEDIQAAVEQTINATGIQRR